MKVDSARTVGVPNVTQFGHAIAGIAAKAEPGFVGAVCPGEQTIISGLTGGRIDPGSDGHRVGFQVQRRRGKEGIIDVVV